MPADPEDSNITTAVATALAKELYSDAKSWIPSLFHKLKQTYAKAATPYYESIPHVLNDLENNQLSPGQQLTLKCKPAPFGPFLRSHFLSPFIGNRSDLRLGPTLQHPNLAIAVMTQITSHLLPVGLYPPLGKDVNHACLYPADSQACGFIGLVPDIARMIPCMPVLMSSRHTVHYNKPCHLTGSVHLIDADTLQHLGLRHELYEEIRQLGRVWFIDATNDDSDCVPLHDASTPELWGGLYASGHLEIASGNLPLNDYIEAFHSALKANGFKPSATSNQAGRREIMIYAKGFRICADSSSPSFFSLHMDAELAVSYSNSRRTFDAVCKHVLNNISDTCKSSSVELRNPLDLDFTYSNSQSAFTVLQSLAADNINDPLTIAIRDWHRKRNLPSKKGHPESQPT